MSNRPHPVAGCHLRFRSGPRAMAGSGRSAVRHARGLRGPSRSRGLTLIQFMFVLVVLGIVAFWVVEYFRGRFG